MGMDESPIEASNDKILQSEQSGLNPPLLNLKNMKSEGVQDSRNISPLKVNMDSYETKNYGTGNKFVT